MCFKLETAMVISRPNFSVDDGSTNFALNIFESCCNWCKERNTTIPTKRKVTLTTHSDFQSSVKLRIFEGERSSCQARASLKSQMVKVVPMCTSTKNLIFARTITDLESIGALELSRD